jgi:PKHD-type hydroxylase
MRFENDRVLEHYIWLDRVFSPAECDRIIAYGEACGLQPAHTSGAELRRAAAGASHGVAASRPRRRTEVRDADLAFLDVGPETQWIYERLGDVITRANHQFWQFTLDSCELAQFTRYRQGQFHAWHMDLGVVGDERRRKLSLTVQLSDPDAYAGGDLEFMGPERTVAASRNRGTVAIFPTYMFHRVTPVERGVRHALVCWAFGPAPLA